MPDISEVDSALRISLGLLPRFVGTQLTKTWAADAGSGVLSADGAFVARRVGDFVEVRNVDTHAPVFTTKAIGTLLAVGRSGQRIVMGSNYVVYVSDAGAKGFSVSLSDFVNITRGSLHPDGKYLAVTVSGESSPLGARLIDLDTPAQIVNLESPGENGEVTGVGFSRTGRYVGIAGHNIGPGGRNICESGDCWTLPQTAPPCPLGCSPGRPWLCLVHLHGVSRPPIAAIARGPLGCGSRLRQLGSTHRGSGAHTVKRHRRRRGVWSGRRQRACADPSR